MDNREPTEEERKRFASYMASQRKIVRGTCEVCGKEFEGTTKRRYCSNTCVVRAFRQRQKAEIQTQQEG